MDDRRRGELLALTDSPTTTPEAVQQGADQPVDDRRRGELLALTDFRNPTTTPEAVQQGADQPVDDRRRGELLALTVLQPLHQRRYNKVLINLWTLKPRGIGQAQAEGKEVERKIKKEEVINLLKELSKRIK